jgi:tyrosyl-tRNA synthetase
MLGPSVSLIDLLTQAGLASSRAEARRLIAGGGVSLNGERQVDPAAHVTVEAGAVLQVGRRRVVRLVAMPTT